MFYFFIFTIVKADSGCFITSRRCDNFPEFKSVQFQDTSVTDPHPAACTARSQHFHEWCGNGDSTSIAATHADSKTTQIYRPNLCDPGWAQYGGDCYIHIWERRTWYEANLGCEAMGSELASIHSEGENKFVFSLTRGISAWIGLTDYRREDEPENWTWTDTTQKDFHNWNKNCTDPTEKGCQPEEKAQQWYSWDGEDKGTSVCKKKAKKPIDFIREWTLDDVAERSWNFLSIEIPSYPASQHFDANNDTDVVVQNATCTVDLKNATKLSTDLKDKMEFKPLGMGDMLSGAVSSMFKSIR